MDSMATAAMTKTQQATVCVDAIGALGRATAFDATPCDGRALIDVGAFGIVTTACPTVSAGACVLVDAIGARGRATACDGRALIDVFVEPPRRTIP